MVKEQSRVVVFFFFSFLYNIAIASVRFVEETEVM